jgi:hypothetical protein
MSKVVTFDAVGVAADGGLETDVWHTVVRVCVVIYWRMPHSSLCSRRWRTRTDWELAVTDMVHDAWEKYLRGRLLKCQGR